jgi:hypothetical protein
MRHLIACGDEPKLDPITVKAPDLKIDGYRLLRLDKSPNTSHTISTEMPNIMGWLCAQQLIEINIGH